jgi:periplasmic glucans biosynthesis protein
MTRAVSRRRLLGGCLLAFLPTLPGAVLAQPAPFSHETVREEARRLAAAPFKPVDTAGVAADLRNAGYDQYMALRFAPEASLLADEKSLFRAELFPAGFVFKEPVRIFIVNEGRIDAVRGTAGMFDWGSAGFKSPPTGEVPLAGFRLLYPLHGESFDEIAAFVGASYFRLIGREQTYGISARGLAIDTGLPRQEEFPSFRAFWLEMPKPGARQVTIHALLDSPAMTGAYRITLHPGTATLAEVSAMLFARHEVSLLGVAPLTSMFLRGESGPTGQGDFRPEVHDSDGLLVETGRGEFLWRPLRNPADLAISSFETPSPRGFGLLQRDRDFDHYQDLEARYHRRPSLWVQPVGDWGDGEVRLIEIPTTSEIHDNIVAFWMPRQPPKAGQTLELHYWLHAFADESRFGARGRVVASRGGALRQEAKPPKGRRFVVDFAGGDLDVLRPEQPVLGDVTVTNARILHARVEAMAPARGWRLVVEVENEGRKPVDLRGYLHLRGDALTETWVQRWQP